MIKKKVKSQNLKTESNEKPWIDYKEALAREFWKQLQTWSVTSLYMFGVLPTPEKRYKFAKDLYEKSYTGKLPEDFIEQFKK